MFGLLVALLSCVAFGGARVPLHARQDARDPVVVKVVGEGHKLLLDGDGRVFGWGDFRKGQLGPSGGATKLDAGYSLPVAIALPERAIDIAAASDTSYAVLESGIVVAWGAGSNGALGNGAVRGPDASKPWEGGSPTPSRVGTLTEVTAIAAGGSNALALHANGTVSAWGPRDAGLIGDGRGRKTHADPPAPIASLPVRVPGVSEAIQVATHGSHALALRKDGHVLAWGSNASGALGREPRQEIAIDAAAEVPGLTDVAAVATGTGVSLAMKRDGTVWVWGANMHGLFGNGDRTDPPGVGYGYELTPRRVPGVANVVALSVGLTGRHALALLKDGTLRGWGNTDWGQIGAGVSGTFQLTPVTPKITGVVRVMAAGNNSFAVRTDGSLWGWGAGGRTEHPFKANTKVPQRVDLALPR
ncbi:RCC1 domain-containing protein [Luteitalea sp.]|uniref:RCC1 domain-containing protein n=1 Tax=Luteitalea sp. TaxID=2004800 RepID=UPI0037CBF3E6